MNKNKRKKENKKEIHKYVKEKVVTMNEILIIYT